ncbi:MAG: hypothetical protein M0T70_04445 [Geobacteraceae bacterium]|nr:hypothetical protein [Geobacteraceae bacterium]
MKHCIVYAFIMMVMAGCDSSKGSAPASEPPVPKVQTEFSTSDKSILTNGNIEVASNRLLTASGDSWGAIKKTSLESISKSPYSNMGKLHKVSGEVYKVEELPPSMGLKGQWSEALMLAGNQNSPLGASSIDCVFHGSPDAIKSGRVATCTGYFIGTFDSANAMGGSVEALVFVGYAKKGR